MKTRFFPAFLACLLLLSSALRAQDYDHGNCRSDDRVMFDVSAEDWVATKTAHVTVSVEAAVTAATAGSTRAEMIKAVNGLAKADWRLTGFDRNQDQTGMERWSATFDARVPESDLSGLGDAAKKMSKAGLQLAIAAIDFSPTLGEMETTRAALRTQIYKIANDQLAALNAAMPGRTYRIALVNFTGDDGAMPMPRLVKGPAAMNMMATAAPEPAQPPMERAEKVLLTARVVFAAMPDGRLPMPQPAPAEPKH